MKVVTLTAAAYCLFGVASSFSVVGRQQHSTTTRSSTSKLFADTSELESVLQSKYPTFNKIVKGNEELWKKLKGPEVLAFTVFIPTEDAMKNNLGEKKVIQLLDDRNTETTNKMGMFHFVDDIVSAEKLFQSAGVISFNGDVVPVERSVSGGFMGLLGGKEDGGSTVGGAKVTATYPVGGDDGSVGVIHEVDEFVSPSILWRYMDQLRIPGSS